MFGFLLLLPLVGALLFQNCSNVKIEGIQNVTYSSLLTPEEEACAPNGASFTTPMRFVFVVDMSMSNIGSLVTLTNDNVTTYSLNTSDGPSDISGERFNKIKKFIEKCGGQNNSKYAIIGFSETAMLENNQSCTNDFEDKNNAIKSIDALKGRQQHDLAIGSRTGQNPFYLQGQTYYSVGLNCAKNKILNDLVQLKDEKPVYKLFFITDGLSTDSTANQDYKPVLLDILNQSSTKAGGVSLFPVFYTGTGAKNQGSQMTKAMSLLDSMAQVIDENQSTILLNEIGNDTNLCDYIKPSIFVHYEAQRMFAVNVTSVMKKNKLFSDSDADGISDDDEAVMGWNPQNSRTSLIQDSLCNRYSKDYLECDEVAKTLPCSEGGVGLIGLNSCDEQFSKYVFGKAISSLDTDSDYLPDWVELIRNTNPVRSDALETPLNDEYPNFKKIALGIDIYNNQLIDLVPENQIMDFSFQESTDLCQEGMKKYKLNFKNIPLVKVKELNDSNKNFDLSHAIDENVIVIFSYWKASGGINLPTKVYAQILKLKINSNAYTTNEMTYVGEF